MEKPKRRITQRGIGIAESGVRPKHSSTVPPTAGVRGVRGTRESSGPPPPRKTAGRGVEVELPEPETLSSRRPRSNRAPIRVDDVGVAAVEIARKVVRLTVPTVLRPAAELAGAPITHRDAFLLSLIDGKLSVQGLVDVAGMPEAQLMVMLQRLARLGIVSLG